MTPLDNIIPHAGAATLLYGKVGQLQSWVAFEAALRVAQAGRSVIFLDHVKRDGVLVEQVTAWRHAHRVEIGHRLQAFTIDERKLLDEAKPTDALLRAIRDLAHAPGLIVRDTSDDPRPFDVGDAAFHRLALIGAKLACPVLHVVHYGRDKPDVSAIPSVEQIWDCSVGLNLAVTITRDRPAQPGKTIKLVGRDGTGIVLFDDDDATADTVPA